MNDAIELLFPYFILKIYEYDCLGKDYLLVAGGRKPSNDFLTFIKDKRKIICADKGVLYCQNIGLIPYVLIGDGDSSGNAWQWAKNNKVDIYKYNSDKDLTDLQLSLKYIIERNDCKSLLVTGIWGGRSDHLYSAIFAFAEISTNIPIVMSDEYETLCFLTCGKKIEIDFSLKPKYISILPITEEAIVSIKGVKWEMNDSLLKKQNTYSISNELSSNNNKITFEVNKGNAALYIFFGLE